MLVDIWGVVCEDVGGRYQFDGQRDLAAVDWTIVFPDGIGSTGR